MPKFEVVSDFAPAGDQPKAIAALAEGIQRGRPVPDAARHHRLGQERHHRLDDRAGAAAHAGPRAQQVAGRPAGQRVPGVLPRQPGRVLRQLLRLLPARGVHRRRATPTSRRTRRSTTRSTGCATRPPSALLTRRDVIVVASVSCIYGLGSPEEYQRPAARRPRRATSTTSARILRQLVDMQYERNDMNLGAGQVPGAGRHDRGPPGLRRDGACASRCSATRSSGSPVVDPLTGEQVDDARRAHRLPGHPLRRRRGADARRPSSASRPSCRSGWPGSRRRASCSRRSACGCAPSTTSR